MAGISSLSSSSKVNDNTNNFDDITDDDEYEYTYYVGDDTDSIPSLPIASSPPTHEISSSDPKSQVGISQITEPLRATFEFGTLRDMIGARQLAANVPVATRPDGIDHDLSLTPKRYQLIFLAWAMQREIYGIQTVSSLSQPVYGGALCSAVGTGKTFEMCMLTRAHPLPCMHHFICSP